MKTLLVLSQHPQLAEAIRAAVDSRQYRTVLRADFTEAEPLLHHGLVHCCLIDADLTTVQAIWLVEKVHRRAPGCPIVIFTGEKSWEWEEEAYLKGVSHILHKPVRERMLNVMLERLLDLKTESAPASPVTPIPAEVSKAIEMRSAVAHSSFHTLQILRDFSAILTHSLCAEAMLKQFLMLLREILGVNRAAIFLRQPSSAFSKPAGSDAQRMRSACAIGLPSGLLEHFDLSFDVGIAKQLVRLGRILRRDSVEVNADMETQKEFELLSAQVAIPILDHESLIGVAVFDGRITGEPLANAELELIFHLLEQLGLAVKNIWLHDQVNFNQHMLADVLRELSSACVVVSQDLKILHANKTAKKYFLPASRRGGELEFSDLSAALGSKVYQVLRTGSALTNLKHQPDDSPGTMFNVTIAPFQQQGAAQPSSALLMVEDLTQADQLQRLQMEASNLRLVKAMADRMAHEIGNALVPLSTHQQLLGDKFQDPEFRVSLDVAMAEGVKRISRLTSQMRFLARDSVISHEAFPVQPLIQEAYQEAQKLHPAKTARLDYHADAKPVIVTGDRAALKHALAEVLLNALQANPNDAKIGVRLHSDTNGNGKMGVHIEIEDNGSGFSADTVKKIPSPFFTTRNVGLGLGLTVTRKIIETHHGKLEIAAPEAGHAGVVRISLPIEAAKA